VVEVFPNLNYHQDARLMYSEPDLNKEDPFIAVLSAGTSDLKVSEEAAISAQVLGCRVERFMMSEWQAFIVCSMRSIVLDKRK